MDISLIANTGIQFFTTEAVFKPDEPVTVNDAPVKPVFFTEVPESADRNRIELVNRVEGDYFLLSELRTEEAIKTVMDLTGEVDDELEDNGVPRPDVSKINKNTLSVLNPTDCYSERNVEGSFVLEDEDHNRVSPFEKVLNQWLPVPMFYLGEGGKSRSHYPSAWCRVRITRIGEDRYRFVWAFDTKSFNADEGEDEQLPFFSSDNTKSEVFGLATKATHLMSFLAENAWVGDYLARLLFGDNVQPVIRSHSRVDKCRHMAWYLGLFTQLRLLGVAPIVTLYNDRYCQQDVPQDPIPIDLVLDIGNSKTCGVLFEEGDFTRSTLLSLRNLTDPSYVYRTSFDMRLVFHRTEFGQNNMGLDSDVFQWRSFLRIGEEAKWLLSQSRQSKGEALLMTHHSSPKRYLWDDEPFEGQWEFLTTDEESIPIQGNAVYVEGLSVQFNDDGTIRSSDAYNMRTSFSRRSLMTCVMVEIIQQAICQINSYDYRNIRSGHGLVDRPRKLNNIIITCPTAMSEAEQVVLRQCASDAYIAILRSNDPMELYGTYDPQAWEGRVSVIPSVKDLTITDAELFDRKVEWGYDEATCCQLVYLYSEVINKYKNDSRKLIEHKGHIRKELSEEGYTRKSLTIGSVDIGAGTTDLMICSYEYRQEGQTSILKPIPQFWDSFFLAGDDILHEIVLKYILKEQNKNEYTPGYGSLFNAVCAKQIAEARAAGTLIDSDFIRLTETRATALLERFCGSDAYSMSYLDKDMRNDFNIQVSVPIAEKMLDMMKNGEPAQSLSYEQIFPQIKPSAHLLDFFEMRFGFRFEVLKWEYSPGRITDLIRGKMEGLLKQLSIILNTFECDVVLLAGRPTSLPAITDLFLKFFPVSPDRLIRMLPLNKDAVREDSRWNCYKVGRWFPSCDDNGYFLDLKPVVAAGAMVGYLGSHNKIPHFQLDVSRMRSDMKSTADYMGEYFFDGKVHTKDVKLTPTNSSASFNAYSLPFFIGCKQINTDDYQARPLYALSLKPGAVVPSSYDLSKVSFTVARRYKEDKEMLELQSARDNNNNDVLDILQLKVRSLTNETSYWLDNGAFSFNN